MEIRSTPIPARMAAPKLPAAVTTLQADALSPCDDANPLEDNKAEKFWRELFSGELFEIGLKLRPEHLQDTISAAKNLGTGLRDVWNGLREKVGELLELPQVEQVLDPATRERTAEVVVAIACGLGYSAAGVQGLGGAYKLASGFRKGSTSQKLDGLTDLTTAAAVATTIAGLGVVPLVMGPVAAVMGIARGGYNAVSGFKTGDARQEIQGLLDTTRSASVGLRLLGQQVGGLATAGMLLGPVACAIQLCRGYYDLSSGLAQNRKPKQVQGLSDIATAVGLTATLTGIGTIPGIALMSAAMGARVLYQFNDRFEAWADQKLDGWGPNLSRATETVERWAEPVLQTVRPLIEKLTGWHYGQDKDRDVGKASV